MPPTSPTPLPADPRRPAPSRALAHDLLDCASTGLVALDPAGNIVLANTAAQHWLGPTLTNLTLEDRATFLGGTETSLPLRTTNGTSLSVTRRATPAGTLLTLAPVDTVAELDPLTGLIGRKAFETRLAILCAVGEVAVLIIDLDRFKMINDDLGHLAGDALLRTVATRLRVTLRQADAIARFDGDEFAIAMPSTPEISAIAERILATLARPYLVERQAATIAVSIGVALSPIHGNTPAELIRAADLALYQAKSAGRGCARLHDPQLDKQARQRHALADDLRRAIPLGQLLLHFQPQICLATNVLTGFEALVRWDHPTRGMISPDQFITLAEDLNLIIPLGEWVLREACRQAMSWPGDISVAVNASPKQLIDPTRLPALIEATLAATGLPPHRLEIEVTETTLMQEAEALDVLQRIRALGVMISMDDFGTGYSSLSQLRRFPFDKLKIDRSFVSELGNSDEAAGVVRAISALGRSLGMTTIAEGVETTTQAEICRADGCSVMQGYLISRPVPADQVAALVHKLSRDAKAIADV